MTNKMTYVNAIDNAIALFSQGGQVDAEDKATVEKLEALKAQLIKRNSADRKPTKAQRENETLKGDILDWLESCEGGQTATAIAEHFSISNPKASALLTAMVKAGSLERTVEKRKAYFSPSENEGAQYLEREVTV
jgi:predicted transcriptional regulator